MNKLSFLVKMFLFSINRPYRPLEWIGAPRDPLSLPRLAGGFVSTGVQPNPYRTACVEVNGCGGARGFAFSFCILFCFSCGGDMERKADSLLRKVRQGSNEKLMGEVAARVVTSPALR